MNGTDDFSPLRLLSQCGQDVVAVAGDEVLDDTEHRPPAKAIGIERSPPRTTAAREPRTTSVYTDSCS